MKLSSCPRILIIKILRKHPDGLTLTSIAELTCLHRHTATKYVYELKGAGIITERDVGSAKLCYLKEGLKKTEEKKILNRLNGEGGWNERKKASADAFKQKSSTGQVQIVTVFMLLFLIPTTVIIAQNATQSINSTGELILEKMNVSNDTQTDLGGNQTGLANAPSVAEILNETQLTTDEFQNQTNASEQNITAKENLTTENLTISNETISNETNATIPEPENQAQNITLPETEQTNITIPEIMQPILSARINSPDKTIRGENFDISAIVSNTGNSDAKSVRLEWDIPPQFEIVSGDSSPNCGTISPDSECMSSLTLSIPMSADIGKNQIKVIVRYEE